MSQSAISTCHDPKRSPGRHHPRVQRAGFHVSRNELYLLANSHAETDPCEGCDPIGRQLGLFHVKASFYPCNVVCVCVAPQKRIIVECPLKFNAKEIVLIIIQAKEEEDGCH